MNILLLGDYPPDPRLGSTKVMVKLQEEFQSLGHRCDVVLADGLVDAPRNPYLRQAFAPLAAWTAAKRLSAAHGPYDVIDVASAEGLWIGRRRSGPLRRSAVVSRSNGLEHLNYRRMLDDHAAGLLHKPWTRRLYHPLVRLTQVAGAARASDRLLLLNDIDRRYALDHRWKAESDIDVVPHGVSLRFLADAPAPDAPRGGGLLFCGTWIATKGVSYLADAFSRLVAAGVRVNLTVLGGGFPEGHIRSAFPEDVQSLLTVSDRAPEEAVMRAYRRHDVLVWPSTYEGFGMVLLEAMSQRLPVVSTPVGCASSLVVDERTGLLVAPRDAAALATALRRMIEDPALRQRCAAAAAAAVQAMTWTATARQTLDVYERARASRRHVH